MHEILNEIKKINSQWVLPTTILMALRARIEAKKKIKNRIDQTFGDGNRGVLIIGPAGAGKTRTMRSIFDGLDLEQCNSDGKYAGKWIASAGQSTVVGLSEILEVFNDSCVFIDELNLDTKAHCEILKQIAHGEICRPRHCNIDPKPFSGLVISSCNGIQLPKPGHLEHLLATLERFIVVRAKSPDIKPEQYADIWEKGYKKPIVNWDLVHKALTNNNFVDLENKEKLLIKQLWKVKSQEILNITRPQHRNMQLFGDIFLFVKRFFNIKDLVGNKDAVQIAQKIINSTIIFNPISLLWLKDSEQITYDLISSKKEATMQEIVTHAENSGLTNSYRTYGRILDRLVQARLIFRTKKGTYSIYRKQSVKIRQTNDLTDAL